MIANMMFNIVTISPWELNNKEIYPNILEAILFILQNNSSSLAGRIL